MTFFTGDSGRLWLANPGQTSFTAVANVQSWTLNFSQVMIERSALGYTDKVITPGIRSMSGNAKILYYRDPPADNGSDTVSLPNEAVSWLMNRFIKEDNNAYDKIIGNIAQGDGDPQTKQSKRIGFKLGVRSGGTNRYISFYGYVTAFTMGINVGEVMAADITFEADGAPYEQEF